MHLTIANDLEVRVTDMTYSWTYAGLLVGHPNYATNHDLVTKVLARAKEMYSHLPVILLPPVLTDPNLLPPTCWIVRLSGPARKPEDDGAALVVVWFTEHDQTRPLAEQMEAAMHNLNWDFLARGWQF